ncbi:hypothetical protein ACLB2K_066666 [Fragaria x ananassa]
MSRPKPVVYQEPVAQIPSGTPTRFPANLVDSKVNVSDPNTRVQMQQQVQDSGYVLQHQYDQQLQQQQLLQQQLQQQQQQFIHPGATPKPTRFSTRENPPPSPPSLAHPLSAATSTHPAAAHYSQGYIGHIMSMLQVSS